MNVGVTIDVQGNITEAVAKKVEQFSPAKVAAVLRDPLRGFWRDHLKSLPTNKRGWPSTGFWEQAADQTDAFVVSEGNSATIVLRCSKTGVRLQAMGGRVSPVKAGALTIPISPVSYGKRASDFTGLFLIKTAKGAYLVQRGEALSSAGTFKQTKESGRGRKKNEARRLRAGLNFLFKLSKGVTVPANKNVIPSQDEFAEVAMGAIERSYPG